MKAGHVGRVIFSPALNANETIKTSEFIAVRISLDDYRGRLPNPSQHAHHLSRRQAEAGLRELRKAGPDGGFHAQGPASINGIVERRDSAESEWLPPGLDRRPQFFEAANGLF